ncbi:MAG: MBL fold metallo-hydrolase [Candidatus Glassbacteria bacterium]|nr:MBL fold metallo-hydrolase [Candidatus Glassbacteria bacterium]
MLAVRKIQLDPLQSNCYLAWDEDSGAGVVIDPGGEGARIIAEIESRRIKPQYILNTHGHGDHVAANRAVRTRFGVPLLIHPDEAPLLADPRLNMSAFYGLPVVSPPADGFLEVGGRVEFGGHELEVLHTPGHSPGGVSFHGHGVVFTGDALFMGSVGRTDFPGCDEDLLLSKIRENLLTLPDDTIVYPGHGRDTTIGIEKRHNPFLI